VKVVEDLYMARNIYRKDLTKSVVTCLILVSSSLLMEPSLLMVANTPGSLLLRWARKSGDRVSITCILTILLRYRCTHQLQIDQSCRPERCPRNH